MEKSSQITEHWFLIYYTCNAVEALGKECVAVLIELYKKNVTVSCVGSDLLSEWAHSTSGSLPLSGGDYTGIPC